jgi:hypothetical protein
MSAGLSKKQISGMVYRRLMKVKEQLAAMRYTVIYHDGALYEPGHGKNIVAWFNISNMSNGGTVGILNLNNKAKELLK